MEMIRARGSQNGDVQVPNNLLQKFFITSNSFCHRDVENRETREKEGEEENKEIELSLGLSMNGQFGTDPRSRKRKNFELGRSSSIPEGFVFDGGDMRRTMERSVSDMFQLDRTRSLPVETETETKRKRSEKTRAFPEFHVQEKNRVEADHGEKDGYTLGKTEKTKAFMEFQVQEKNRVEADHGRKDGYTLGETEKAKAFVEFKVPGPVNDRGKNGNTTTKRKNQEQEVCGMEKARNILEDMPCVSTREVGADGKRVEGFLYWYGGNKEEVKIVCVCHGSFLSPAEFVRHGGGTVTINPLRHIVVKLPSH